MRFGNENPPTATVKMNADLLKLLRLLVESMPPDIGEDGYTNTSHEQREARELLKRLESDGQTDT